GLRERRVPGQRLRRGTRDRLAAGNRGRTGVAGEMAFEDAPVEEGFAGRWRVERVARRGRGELAVADGLFRMRLEAVDPGVADAVAELFLLPPQDLVRERAGERFAQHRLLDA